MAKMKQIDPLQLQRLVDGELNAQQVQHVLTEAQSSPEQWQEIAVGFVESQLWNRAFLNQSNGVSVPTGVGGKTDSGIDPIDSPVQVASDVPVVAKHSTEKKVDLNSPRATSFSWLVLAASLFAAAAIGFMLSQIQHRNLPENSIAQVVPPATNPLVPKSNDLIAVNAKSPGSQDQPQITQADYHLEVPPENLGELGSAGTVPPVPLIAVSNANDLRKLNLFSQQRAQIVSPEMLKRLTGSGYQLKQDVDLISGRLEDGRTFFVPVRTIRFVSGQ